MLCKLISAVYTDMYCSSINGVQDMAGFRAVLAFKTDGIAVDVSGSNADSDSNKSVNELDIEGLHQCGVAAEDSNSNEFILVRDLFSRW